MEASKSAKTSDFEGISAGLLSGTVRGPAGKEFLSPMKVRCSRDPLLTALQSASAVVPARSPKPVLTNVKLEASHESAVLSATDLEVGIRTAIEGWRRSRPVRRSFPAAA